MPSVPGNSMERFCMQEWTLKRTVQCDLCPWRKDVNPLEIPNQYDVEKHRNLKGTIAQDGVLEQVLAHANKKPLRIMACHEDHEAHCVGWLKNQLGAGNNIRLRIAMIGCENLGEIALHGEQHKNFEDTLPK